MDDVVASQPAARSNRAVMVIDEVLRSIPEYQPRKICKYFITRTWHEIDLLSNIKNLRRNLRREYMVNQRITISCVLGCVSKLSKVI